MEINLSMVLCVLGLALTVVEVWRPRLSVILEDGIDNNITMIKQYQIDYLSEFRVLSRISHTTLKEVFKGPKIITFKELKANIFTSFENIKALLWFYLATAFNMVLLRPVAIILGLLNFIGKGRAVGGVGIVLATLSVFL